MSRGCTLKKTGRNPFSGRKIRCPCHDCESECYTDTGYRVTDSEGTGRAFRETAIFPQSLSPIPHYPSVPTPTKGRVLYNGIDVTALPPEKRNIAQVFQFPVLYDTMTVYENLAFPLQNRRMGKIEIDQRVHEVAEILDLTAFLKHKAAGLAADAKQKISLGRGLVRSDVAAILFDEPLTVIDPHLKWHLRRKLKEIHEQLKLTLIYVTHDQMEALTFAEKVVIMYEGEIVQTGTPEELFENPEHKFVGFFIGSPGMNFLRCRLDGNVVYVDGAGIKLEAKTADAAQKALGALELGIRPKYLEVSSTPVENGLAAIVKNIEDLGSYKIVTILFNDKTLYARLPEDTPVRQRQGLDCLSASKNKTVRRTDGW